MGLGEKGFFFTLEAFVSLMLFSLIIFTLPQAQESSLKELAISQQTNDLLRVWSAKNTNQNEMIHDTQELFGQNAELWVNEKQIVFAEKKKNAFSSEGIIVDEQLKENKIRVLVYYD
jgi:hypothetical protein